MDTVFLEHSVRSSLVDFLERRVQCVLRDGKILIGTLLSFDQFYNLVLGHTVKRVILDKQYAEERVGLYLIRGENVATLSELDLEKEERQNILERVSMQRMKELMKAKGVISHRNKASVLAGYPLDME